MKREDLLAPAQYNIVDELDAYRNNDQKTAVRWMNEKKERRDVSYKTLLEKTSQFAGVLLDMGITKGDKILIIVPRLPEAYMIYLACLKIGAVAIPSSEMLRSKDLVYRLQHSEAVGIIAHHHSTEEVDAITEELPHLQFKLTLGGAVDGWQHADALAETKEKELATADTKSSDVAFLSYTSGTTGNPKGVIHTHAWAYAHVRTAATEWLGVKENDIVWATAAPGWQKWVWSPFLSTVMLGATAFVYHGGFKPDTYLQLLQDENINVLCCTPTEYRLMAKVDNLASYSLPHLRSTVSAGEPLNRPVIEAFKHAFNVDVRDGYGQTENTLLVGTLLDMEVKPGSMGRPTPGNPVSIINDMAEPAAVGEVGDIAVHKDCPALFKHYYRDAERTAGSFRGDWYLTGDQASMDEDGYFWFEGRSDDIIISSGYTIGPFEVEDALLKHPQVQECAVVAAPDEVRGNIVKAFVVIKGEHPANKEHFVLELQNHVKQMTAPYKYPRRIEFIEELPKTTSGKIRRIDLRKQSR